VGDMTVGEVTMLALGFKGLPDLGGAAVLAIFNRGRSLFVTAEPADVDLEPGTDPDGVAEGLLAGIG
jgi:hypothetical protein